jgi:hypothetical protein
MEAVSLQPHFANFDRQRNELGNGCMALMETRIEAGNLVRVREPLRNFFNGSQIVRLM